MKRNSRFSHFGFRLGASGRFVLMIVLVVAVTAGAQEQAPSPAPAIQITLTSGQTVETTSLRRDRDMIMARINVAGSTGEVGYQLAQIQRIHFPEPVGVKRASDLLLQGQAERALAEINPVVAYYGPFRGVEGSWWGPAAVIKVSALAALGRDREAEPLAQEIQRTTKDPEVARAANLRIARALIDKQDYEKAAQICDAATRESADASVLADAWVCKGDLHFARKEWDAALLSYLRVPVFYPGERLHLPHAMLGSARAYRRLEDLEKARRSFTELVAMFPKSAEANIAQTELQKLPKPAENPTR
jgi:tetratricopeptide (TPR) repeat protein